MGGEASQSASSRGVVSRFVARSARAGLRRVRRELRRKESGDNPGAEASGSESEAAMR
jgi:hypothetical protein